MHLWFELSLMSIGQIELSSISPASFDQVPLYKVQYTQPCKVILGSPIWKRIRIAMETQSTIVFLLDSYVLSTVESIEFQCSEI